MEKTMDIMTILSTGTTAITFAEKFMELAEKSKNEPEPTSFTEIINSLKTDAITSCREISQELRNMKTELRASGIDPEKTIGQLYDDLKWYDFLTKSKLKKHERKFYEIYQSLAMFIDDATSVLICSGSTQTLSESFKKSQEKKQQLDVLVNSDVPIIKIIDEMLGMNEFILFRLQGGSQQSAIT
jgi:hypothetical protein